MFDAFVAVEKKSVSSFKKKGKVLNLGGEWNQHSCGVVATVVLHESS